MRKSQSQEVTKIELRASRLPPVPEKLGLAGVYAGSSHGTLIVAGGANFPDRPPWEGGPKTWHDSIYVLDRPAGTWQTVGKLPRPLAYGVAISTAEGVVCVGGSDSARHYPDTFVMSWESGRVAIHPLPSTIVVLGGDDGTKAGFQPPAKHPGFATDAIRYNSQSGRWSGLGSIPVSRVNLPSVFWRNAYVLPSGEVCPGVRSPEVWSLAFPGTIGH